MFSSCDDTLLNLGGNIFCGRICDGSPSRKPLRGALQTQLSFSRVAVNCSVSIDTFLGV